MTSPERKKPTIVRRKSKLKIGTVVRMQNHNRQSKIGDNGATTPNVDLTVNFEDRYVHQAQQSPEGSLEGTVKLKFARPSSDDAPAAKPPGIIVPSNRPTEAPVPVDPQPSTTVLPPAKFPDRISPRVQLGPAQQSTRPKRRILPLALVGVLAAGVLIPSQIDVAPGFDILQQKAASTQTDAIQPLSEPLAGTVETAKITAVVQPAEDPAQAAELRVAAAGQGPELEADASNPKVGFSTEPEPVTKYSAALQELDRLKSEPVPPPKPQKLASPSGAGRLDFAFSMPVVTPPDPNEMAVVPDNPFVQTVLEDPSGQIAIASTALQKKPLWRAAVLAAAPQTDLPAVASAIAPPPPAKPGPKILANIPDLPVVKIQENPAKLPVLSSGPAFDWKAAILLGTPGTSDAPYAPLPYVADTFLVAAVAVLRPDAPNGAGLDILNPPAPPQLRKADLRQRFIKPPKEYINSDTAIDTDVTKPALPPPPKLGVGKLKILSQFWQTHLDLEFDDPSETIRISKAQPSDPDWLVPGRRITALNGQNLRFRTDYLAEIKAFCAGVTSGKADLSLAVDGVEQTLPVSCLRRTALSNGLVLEGKFKRRKWKIYVVEEAINNLSDLRIGDQLVLDYSSDTPLNTPDALRETITAMRDTDVTSIELGIIRDGTIETAVLRVSGTQE